MSQVFLLHQWRVDPSLRTVSGAQGVVHLEPKQMQVLLLLAEHPGQVVTKEHLLRTVWADTFVGDEVLSRAIADLRRAFGDDAKTSRVIQTIPKGGYRLVAPLRFDSGEGTNDLAQAGVATPPARSRTLQLWLVGAVGSVAALLLALAVTRPGAAPSAATPRSVRVVPFTSFPGVEGSPAFSPDGGSIAFVRRRYFQSDLYRMPVEGGTPVRLARDDDWCLAGSTGQLAWSPDGQILFSSCDRGDSAALLRVPATGGSPVALPVGESATAPALDRSGRRLAYVRTLKDQQIFEFDLTRPAAAPHVIAPSSRDEVGPQISPDGRRLAFASARAGLPDIWVANADGSNGKEKEERELDGPSVWRVPVGGGQEEPVLKHALSYEYSRSWAVVDDGIYFLATADLEHPLVGFFSFTTRQRTTIAPLPKMPVSFDATMSVSPDGRRLLVALQDTNDADIMLAENPQ